MKRPDIETMKASAEAAGQALGRKYMQRYKAPLSPSVQEVARTEAMATLGIGVSQSLRRWGLEGSPEAFTVVLLFAGAAFEACTRELWLEAANE